MAAAPQPLTSRQVASQAAGPTAAHEGGQGSIVMKIGKLSRAAIRCTPSMPHAQQAVCVCVCEVIRAWSRAARAGGA